MKRCRLCQLVIFSDVFKLDLHAIRYWFLHTTEISHACFDGYGLRKDLWNQVKILIKLAIGENN